jgi:hypothetical protein
MSDTPTATTEGSAPDPHAPDHAAGHGDDSHGSGGDALGPFDVVMWTFGMVGVMLGILVWAALAISTTAI